MVDIEFDIDDIEESDIKGFRQMVPMILPDDDFINYEQGLETLPEELPIIPLRDAVLFPKVTIPIMVGREKSRRLISYLEKQENKHVLVVTQKNPDDEDPEMEDLMVEGVIAEVMRVMQVSPDTYKLFFLCRDRNGSGLDRYILRPTKRMTLATPWWYAPSFK